MKSTTQSLFIGLAILAGVQQATAQVTNLGIAPVTGGQPLIYWPMNSATNYVLQSTTNLATPNWKTEDDPIPVMAVTVSNTASARFYRLVSTNPPTGMVVIPAGWFKMGDTLDGETNAAPTNLYVSAFFMDTNVVTLGTFQSYYALATNGILGYDYAFDNIASGNGPNYPATENWYDCVKWCNARSQLDGLTPVYYTDAGLTQVYKTGNVAPYQNRSANGYRLPTEAEWEKAARGGLTGLRFPWGYLITEAQANYYSDATFFSNYDRGPTGPNTNGFGGFGSTPVGSFDVNGYGLYDMAGNVVEWCWDWYGTPYGQPSAINPTGPATGADRIQRGGGFDALTPLAKCAYRYYLAPNTDNQDAGFRCVRGF